MKATFPSKCALCDHHRPDCATVAMRGCNAWGDREIRVLIVCGQCRKDNRSRYIVHPKHK